MNKKNNRKGFTIVELVIVIAVIAILATVLVPTFSGIIDKANTSAALQNGRNIYNQYVANVDYKTSTADPDVVVKVTVGGADYYVTIVNGGATGASKTEPAKPYDLLTQTTSNGVTTYSVNSVSG